MGQFVSHRVVNMSRNEEKKSKETTPSTTLVIAWARCHRYTRDERYRNKKVNMRRKRENHMIFQIAIYLNE